MFTIQTNDLKLIAAPTGHVATHRAEPLPSMNAKKGKGKPGEISFFENSKSGRIVSILPLADSITR